jgi:hypothetical protein
MQSEEEDVKELKRLTAAENKLIADFEESCVRIDLDDFSTIKKFIGDLDNIHTTLKRIDLEFNQIINSLFPINFEKLTSRKKEEREGICRFDYHDNKLISFMQSYLSLLPEEAESQLKLFLEIIQKCLFNGRDFKGEEGHKNISKLISDIFRILQYDCGKVLLSEINEKLKDKFLSFYSVKKRIMYIPQVAPLLSVEEYERVLKKFEDMVVEEHLSIEDSINKISTLVESEENKNVLLFKIREGFDFEVSVDHGLCNLKLVLSEFTSQKLPALSCCLRFISLFHEFVHIARTMNGLFYKRVPLSSMSLLIDTYQNAEELYAIRLNEKFNENLLRKQLGQKERITHLGIGLTDKELEDYSHEVNKNEWHPEEGRLINFLKELKRCYVISAMELGILKSKELKTKDFLKLEEFDNQDYLYYQNVLLQTVGLKEGDTSSKQPRGGY